MIAILALHSVQQKIQQITRMNPSKIAGNVEIMEQFKQLMRDNVNFVNTMSDPKLDFNVQRMYSTRQSATAQADDYVTTCLKHLRREGIEFCVCPAQDHQKTAHSRADLKLTHNEEIQSHLDRKVREPRRLIFFDGATFEATVNGDGYSQSQILLMTKIPSQQDIEHGWDITLFAAPADYVPSLFSTEVKEEAELLENGWKKVQISIAPERLITCNGSEAYRKQYTLRHLGASTINKQMVSPRTQIVAFYVDLTLTTLHYKGKHNFQFRSH
jgi:hypothetical protein